MSKYIRMCSTIPNNIWIYGVWFWCQVWHVWNWQSLVIFIFNICLKSFVFRLWFQQSAKGTMTALTGRSSHVCFKISCFVIVLVIKTSMSIGLSSTSNQLFCCNINCATNSLSKTDCFNSRLVSHDCEPLQVNETTIFTFRKLGVSTIRVHTVDGIN